MAILKKSPYDKYKQTEINTANQGKLIVMLYDGAIKFLNIALENMNPVPGGDVYENPNITTNSDKNNNSE